MGPVYPEYAATLPGPPPQRVLGPRRSGLAVQDQAEAGVAAAHGVDVRLAAPEDAVEAVIPIHAQLGRGGAFDADDKAVVADSPHPARGAAPDAVELVAARIDGQRGGLPGAARV